MERGGGGGRPIRDRDSIPEAGTSLLCFRSTPRLLRSQFPKKSAHARDALPAYPITHSTEVVFIFVSPCFPSRIGSLALPINGYQASGPSCLQSQSQCRFAFSCV